MQCGAKRSKCADCHGVSTTTPWHRDHAFADLCAACHAGNPEAKEAAEAHVGLGDPKTGCHACHAPAISYESSYAALAPATAAPVVVEPHGRSGPNAFAAFVAIVLGAVLITVWRRR